MLSTVNAGSFSDLITVDGRNKRLVVEGYAPGTKPSLLSDYLIDLAAQKELEKIWLWALPADVPDFLACGFQSEGSLFRGDYEEFTVSLAYYPAAARGHSNKLQAENDLLAAVRAKPVDQAQQLPLGIELKLLNESYSEHISQLLTQVFATYPSPVENPQYIRSLIQKGNIFAGAFSRQELIALAAAYPDPVLNRCEMTDCATLINYRGYSLTERLLGILEREAQKRGSFNLYTLARAQSFGMNRVFHKLGYRYRGRLINNCHIGGSYEDMNLWVR